MQITKTDFKIILNHMKLLSSLENNELIKETQNGKTNYNDINQLINIYSPNKVSNLMNKINKTFLISNNISNIGGGRTTNNKNKLEDYDLPNHIKEPIKDIIDKLKFQLAVLKEKDIMLTNRENILIQNEFNSRLK
jgi:hypothetical protein